MDSALYVRRTKCRNWQRMVKCVSAYPFFKTVTKVSVAHYLKTFQRFGIFVHSKPLLLQTKSGLRFFEICYKLWELCIVRVWFLNFVLHFKLSMHCKLTLRMEILFVKCARNYVIVTLIPIFTELTNGHRESNQASRWPHKSGKQNISRTRL